jgi:GT2 family glycosyltransferase
MKNCDIIIPVYNAFDSFKKCIESVIANTDLQTNRLIIIDDKSTDKRAIPFVESTITRKKKNILLIKNEANLGFTKTVNIGMKLSGSDVLLLNSDTEVTKNWLTKIQKCAYSAENTATVTPLSNNASIASVPNFASANEIPKSYNLKKYQSLIDKTSYKEYPEIPTGVGFCLFIKREALDAVGFFDEKSYGKGYGEEEDFCYRCLNHGYKHILCDDAIVYHKSGESFLDHYKDVYDQRMNLLKARYPFYKGKTERWLSRSPLKYINKNIKYNLCLNNGNANVLILIHTWELRPDKGKSIGGTPLHVYDLIKGLAHKYNFHVLAPYNDVYRLCSYWETGEESVAIYSAVSECYSDNFFFFFFFFLLEEIIRIFFLFIILI